MVRLRSGRGEADTAKPAIELALNRPDLTVSFCQVAQFHWDPDTYLALMREEVPDYERLQEEAVAATGADRQRVLELGTGTGETARRVLARHPGASLVGFDASEEMLDHARVALPAARAELRLGRLEDPLPEGPFDLVVSVLAVHHLDGPGKSDLFGRVAAVLSPGGRFVLGDLVVPDESAYAVTPIDGDYDTPSTVADQQAWMLAAGLRPRVAWARRDLAVLVGSTGTGDEVRRSQPPTALTQSRTLSRVPLSLLVLVSVRGDG